MAGVLGARDQPGLGGEAKKLCTQNQKLDHHASPEEDKAISIYNEFKINASDLLVEKKPQ